jgi:hypothetical protein
MTPTSREWSTAYHEAGHAVSAWHYGVRIKRVSIIEDDGSLGHCEYVKSLGTVDFAYLSLAQERKIHNKIITGFAGGQAQRPIQSASYRHFHARADETQIVRLIASLVNADSVATALYAYLRAIAETVVEARWTLIQAVAKELVERRAMDGKALAAILLAELPRASRGKIQPPK